MLHNVWLLYNERMLYIVILNQVLLSQLGFMLIMGNGVPMEEREDRREEKQDRNNICVCISYSAAA